jgi:ribosome maturation factor RimP
MSWQEAVTTSVTGMGFDLVEIERSAGGLLRITIDMPFVPGQPEQFITVEDCESVTKQLRFLLEVENVDYNRLEVGSPGIDRLLRGDADFARFAGEVIDITLKEPIGSTESGVSANRKKFRGTLEDLGEEAIEGQAKQWQLVWSDAPPVKPGVRVSKKRQEAPLQAMQFEYADVREARLAPIVDFRGRKPKAAPAPSAVA